MQHSCWLAGIAQASLSDSSTRPRQGNDGHRGLLGESGPPPASTGATPSPPPPPVQFMFTGTGRRLCQLQLSQPLSVAQ
jgi:hypothetical protein